MVAINFEEQRGAFRRAYVRRFGTDPNQGEVDCAVGVATLETQCGLGWKGAGAGSRNLGAIQCGSSWKGAKFTYQDTHPNKDGTSTLYKVDFRSYPDWDAAWDDYVAVVYVNRGRSRVRMAAACGDVRGVSEDLYRSGYYEGFGATAEERVANHFRSLTRAIARARNQTIKIERMRAEGLPDLRRGDSPLNGKGAAVWLLQLELAIPADEIFGKGTEQAVKSAQALFALPATGVADARTWAALLNDSRPVG